MSLDTLNKTALDDQVFNDALGAAQSGFGWTARPFHPKPLGHQQMKEFFIQTFKHDEVPGVIDVDAVPSPTITSAPSPTVNCGDNSPEDSDGLCTCSVASLIFTTFTPSGGPGNDCGAKTIIPPGAGNFGGSLGEIPASVASQEQGSGVFTTILAVAGAP